MIMASIVQSALEPELDVIKQFIHQLIGSTIYKRDDLYHLSKENRDDYFKGIRNAASGIMKVLDVIEEKRKLFEAKD